MAKGHFGKHDVNWQNDYRCKALKHPAYKWLNFVLWQCCVRERLEHLPPQYNSRFLANEAGIDFRTVPKALKKMEELELIKWHDQKTIEVFGVRELHETEKFTWKNINVDIDATSNRHAANMKATCGEHESNIDVSAMYKNTIEKLDKKKHQNLNNSIKNEDNHNINVDINVDIDAQKKRVEKEIEKEIDKETEDIKPSQPVNSKYSGTGPKNTQTKKGKLSPKTGWQASEAINAHSRALSSEVTETSPMVLNLFKALLKIREVGCEPERLMGLILQARRAGGVDDRVGYCISIIRNMKYVVADGCLADAKKILRDLTEKELDKQVVGITPDLGIDDE